MPHDATTIPTRRAKRAPAPVKTAKTEKTEKASVRQLPNNLSMMSSTSQLGSINEHEAFTDVDTDVDTDADTDVGSDVNGDMEVGRDALTHNSGWLCW